MLSAITEAYFIGNPGEGAKFYGANVANYGNLAVVQREANALCSALVSYFTRLTAPPAERMPLNAWTLSLPSFSAPPLVT